MMFKPPFMVAGLLASFCLLMLGQTGVSGHLITIPNIANLSAVAILGYIQIWIVCKGFPKWLDNQTKEREAVEIRHRAERVEDNKEYLQRMDAIESRNEEHSKQWQKTIERVVRNCEERKQAEK